MSHPRLHLPPQRMAAASLVLEACSVPCFSHLKLRLLSFSQQALRRRSRVPALRRLHPTAPSSTRSRLPLALAVFPLVRSRRPRQRVRIFRLELPRTHRLDQFSSVCRPSSTIPQAVLNRPRPQRLAGYWTPFSVAFSPHPQRQARATCKGLVRRARLQ